MNVTDRFRAAVTAFRQGSISRDIRISRTINNGKAMPYQWPDFRLDRASFKLIDEQAFISEGYDINALVYAAIMYKALSLASIPIVAYRGETSEPEELPDDHPLSALCMRPNPSMSWREYMLTQVIYLNLSGNAYVYYDRQGEVKGCPAAMWPLNPLRTYIVPTRNRRKVLGFIYIPEGRGEQDGIPMLPEDVGHIKFSNPSDPLDGLGYGMPPLLPAARSIDVDNMVTKFLHVFFERGAVVSGILKFDVPLDDPTVKRIRERWLEIYGGSENWYKPGVLDQGGDYSRIGLTFDEMGFAVLDERNEARILQALRVPPILIGSRLGLMRSTYSNYQEARKAFWEDVALGEASLFETDHQYYMQSDDGGWVQNDYSDIPALRQDTPALVGAFTSLVSNGISKYQAAMITGLDVGQLPDGDVIYMPMNLVPVGKVGEEETETVDAETGIVETVTEPEPPPTSEEGDIPEAEAEAEETAKAISYLASELKRANDLLEETKDHGIAGSES